ncbi:MAG: hypothetical protein AVDCRST_MAG08-1425, partial [uncultured Acetobacteraceae bacterium]
GHRNPRKHARAARRAGARPPPRGAARARGGCGVLHGGRLREGVGGRHSAGAGGVLPQPVLHPGAAAAPLAARRAFRAPHVAPVDARLADRCRLAGHVRRLLRLRAPAARHRHRARLHHAAVPDPAFRAAAPRAGRAAAGRRGAGGLRRRAADGQPGRDAGWPSLRRRLGARGRAGLGARHDLHPAPRRCWRTRRVHRAVVRHQRRRGLGRRLRARMGGPDRRAVAAAGRHRPGFGGGAGDDDGGLPARRGDAARALRVLGHHLDHADRRPGLGRTAGRLGPGRHGRAGGVGPLHLAARSGAGAAAL